MNFDIHNNAQDAHQQQQKCADDAHKHKILDPSALLYKAKNRNIIIQSIWDGLIVLMELDKLEYRARA